MPAMNVVAIVNPLSGAGAHPEAAAARVAALNARFAAAGLVGTVHVTERPRHATELATAAVARGVDVVLAWGGDGTINEVGTVLAGTPVALGIVPAGSGNGFAAAVGIPRMADAAIEAALHGTTRAIDVGEIDGRLFFNIAGIGIDAAIAKRFNEQEQGKRGMWPYLRIGLMQAFQYRGRLYRITLDDRTTDVRALLIAFANGREYGSGACIAPHAQDDDGRLEAIVAGDRPPLARIWAARHLLRARPMDASRVTFTSIVRARVESDGPIPYHVDGEPGEGGAALQIGIRPGALRVRVPKGR
jgi:YegS/Rv2252/BmrU family lipid kinase